MIQNQLKTLSINEKETIKKIKNQAKITWLDSLKEPKALARLLVVMFLHFKTTSFICNKQAFRDFNLQPVYIRLQGLVLMT